MTPRCQPSQPEHPTEFYALAATRTAFTQDTAEAAHRQWRPVADGLRERFAKRAALMGEAEPDVLAYMDFHYDHWAKIRSTNPLERVNGEIKRRTDVWPSFPTMRQLFGSRVRSCWSKMTNGQSAAAI